MSSRPVTRRTVSRALLALTGYTAAGPNALAAASSPKQSEKVKEFFPVLSRQEGVWAGMFRRLDARGRIQAEFKAQIITRFLPDDEWPNFLHQTNIYDLPDGSQQVIDTMGEYRDGRMHFESDRVKGWSADDLTDPYKRTVLLYMEYKSNPGQYVYEIINLSDDGRYRTRMTQFLTGGRTDMRTMIDEEKVADDWWNY